MMAERAIIANSSSINNEYPDRFREYLLDQGLSGMDVHNHVFNGEFHPNEFLKSYRPISMAKGYRVIT